MKYVDVQTCPHICEVGHRKLNKLEQNGCNNWEQIEIASMFILQPEQSLLLKDLLDSLFHLRQCKKKKTQKYFMPFNIDPTDNIHITSISDWTI